MMKTPHDIKSFRLYAARTQLRWFIHHTLPTYDCQWFHKYICDELDKFIRSATCNKLAIFVPYQSGKSEIVSRRLPAYIFGLKPSIKIAACSYNDPFAQKFNRDVQRVIMDDAYKEVFPGTVLNEKNVVSDSHGNFVRNAHEFEIVNHKGLYKAVGIGGGLTGCTVDIGLIDDPVKDKIEASSTVYQNRVWEWYNEVFKTRLHNKSKQIICMTRWHENDLAGKILENETDWKVICLPGIKEDDSNPIDPREIGEALWEDKHSKQSYLDMERISPRTYNSLIQQHPFPSDGSIFLKQWFRYYDVTPQFEMIYQSWDCTFKGTNESDYVVGTIWGKSGANMYLIGLYRGKWDFVKTLEMIRTASSQYPGSVILIEEKANGAAVINSLRRQIPAIIPINPTESKESRAYAVTYYFEAGNIYFPASHIAEWIDQVTQELLKFPNAKHDDIVDSITQVIKYCYLTNSSWCGHVRI